VNLDYWQLIGWEPWGTEIAREHIDG
jgi:hypothetical protein